MPKVFVVEKAFLSTQEDKKTPQVVETKGGEMHKYMVQFKDQSIPGWIGILKKPGNQVNVGDEMYGVLEENNWGKPQFTRMQLPQDGSVQLKTSSSAPKGEGKPANVTTPSGTIEEKLDYLTVLLEAFLSSQGVQTKKKEDVAPTDIDDEEISLVDLPY